MARYLLLRSVGFITGRVEAGSILELNTGNQQEKLGISDADITGLLARGIISLAANQTPAAEDYPQGTGMTQINPQKSFHSVVIPQSCPIGSLSGVQTGTLGTVVTSQVPFVAVQIGFMVPGGFGDSGVFKALVAGTDDLGTFDFSIPNDANFKKPITPKKGGSTYNVIAASPGDPGWQWVTKNNGTATDHIVTDTAATTKEGVTAKFLGYIGSALGTVANTTLTVTALYNGYIGASEVVLGVGVANGTTIVSQLTGTTGGIGTYTVVNSQALPSVALSAVTSLNIAWSDIIAVDGSLSSYGLYPLLCRVVQTTTAAQVYSRIGILPGEYTGINQKTDRLAAKHVTFYRVGDNIGTMEAPLALSWNDGHTITDNNSAPPPIMVRFFSSAPQTTIIWDGDSRFATSSELLATKAYLTLQVLTQERLFAAGLKTACVNLGASGNTSAIYQHRVLKVLLDEHADYLIYLVYTVNDGSTLTDGVTAKALARAAEVAAIAKEAGTVVIMLTGFPKATGFTGNELVNLAKIRAFCANLAYSVLDPVTLYGDATGVYLTSWSYDTNHMKQVGYADLAARIADIIL